MAAVPVLFSAGELLSELAEENEDELAWLGVAVLAAQELGNGSWCSSRFPGDCWRDGGPGSKNGWAEGVLQLLQGQLPEIALPWALVLEASRLWWPPGNCANAACANLAGDSESELPAPKCGRCG
ncbi:hypothetical protein VOLCADRAFT_89373 [Volvox carteri f. nagariensis]|uniref:Uncharacterized protein n=1 Tax=Volvox carteri f. nagariensis TaxID=3068 RepID=D8TRJ1_VOLCA|nr:uncharacterized protein VOLCADRAFT_89373 [Volvox carteri f. nagariensis]EFJ49901.1 hypothetical protein VOLCADRAFT_89373 [Volvox carteri f. nagariensis]|eukprot:XP_002948966.1 hypothetical protein VOLCADRAFT_89373 [Volvox carteri f. nagariensis]